MPDIDDKIAFTDAQSKQLEDTWKDFTQWRSTTWPNLLRRRAETSVPPDLAAYAKGLNVQTPALEDWLMQHKSFQILNLTKVGAQAQEETDAAERSIADAEVWYSSWIRRMDENRRIAGGNALGQWANGCAGWALDYKMPLGKGQDGDFDVAAGDLADYVTKMMARREENYHGLALEPDYFGLRYIPMDGRLKFTPLDNPTLYVETTKHTFVDYKDWRGLGETKVRTLKDLSGLVILGEGTQEDASHGTETITLTRKAQKMSRSATSGDTWVMQEYVSVGPFSEDKAQLFDEYECPVQPYFHVPSGNENLLESDPHLRYRPGLYPAYVLAERLNALTAIITATATRSVSIGFAYAMVPGNLSPAMMEFAETMGWTVESVGTQSKVGIPMPSPGSTEIPLSLELRRWPIEMEDSLLKLLEMTQQELEAYRPSRILTGQAEKTAQESTATVYLDLHQGASLPYSTNLGPHDRFIEKVCYAMQTCVLKWEDECPGMSYPVVTTADEPCLYVAPPEPGKLVFVDYEKLRHPHVITVLTRNETAEELIRNRNESRMQLDRHEITFLDHLSNIGTPNPKRKEEELEEELLEQQYNQRAGIPSTLSAMIDFAAQLTGDPVLLEVAQAGAQQQGAPGVPPPLDTGKQPPATNNNAGPAMTAAPVASPSGGSSGVI